MKPSFLNDYTVGRCGERHDSNACWDARSARHQTIPTDPPARAPAHPTLVHAPAGVLTFPPTRVHAPAGTLTLPKPTKEGLDKPNDREKQSYESKAIFTKHKVQQRAPFPLVLVVKRENMDITTTNWSEPQNRQNSDKPDNREKNKVMRGSNFEKQQISKKGCISACFWDKNENSGKLPKQSCWNPKNVK